MSKKMLDSPFGAGFAACLPRDVLGEGNRDIYLVKEVRYAGCTEYNLFMHPNGNKNISICIGGFPDINELKKLGDALKREIESGKALDETFVDGAKQIVEEIEKAERMKRYGEQPRDGGHGMEQKGAAHGEARTGA